MNTYTAYSRSIILFVVYTFLYIFLDLLLLGISVDIAPEFDDGYLALIFFTLIFIAFYLAQLTSRSKFSVEINGNILLLKWISRGIAIAGLSRAIPLRDIRSVIHIPRIRGDIMELNLSDGSQIKLFEGPALFIKTKGFAQLASMLVHQKYSNEPVDDLPKKNAKERGSTLSPVRPDSRGMKEAKRKLYVFLCSYVLVGSIVCYFVLTADVAENVMILLKIILVIGGVLGAFGVKYVISRLGAMAEKIDKEDRDRGIFW